VGYDNLGLAVDYEFPQIQKGDTSKQSKKDLKPQATIPNATVYNLPEKLEQRLKILSRKVKIFSRINIKIKPADINTYLHHLVNVFLHCKNN
jgi:predicted DNA-binding protein